MNKQFSTSKIIALTAAAGAATAIGGLTAHADAVPASAPVQQQAPAADGEAALQSANAQAEDKLAAANSQADSADAAAATEKINSASAAYQNDVNAENQAYQSAVSQASDAHQSAVSHAAADGQASAAQAAAARSAAVSAADSDYQAAVSAAAAAKNAAVASAQAAQSAAVSQAQQSAASKLQAANAEHQAKINQQIAANSAAEQAAEQAVQQAVSDAAAKPVTAVKAAQGTTDQAKLTDYGHRILNHRSPRATDASFTPMVQYLGSIEGSTTPDLINDPAATVSSEDQLPMTFAPGIIVYDQTNDHSERIGSQLTDEQVAKLNQLNIHWTNQLRDYWKNHPELKYVTDTRNASAGRSLNTMNVQQLSTTDAELSIAQQIAKDREAANYGYKHTGTDLSKPAVKSFSNYFTPLTDHIQNDAKLNLGGMTGENMYVVSGSTMLELEVSLYNHLQAMYWGEAENHNGTITSGTAHLHTALTPDMFGAASAFQKTGDHKWIFLTEFIGGYRWFNASDADVTAAAHKIQSESPQVSMSLVQSIMNKQQSGAADAAQTAVANAKKHLADVKAADKAALDKLEAEDPAAGIKQAEQAAVSAANKIYDQAVAKADAAYDQAVSAAKTARDQAVKQADQQAAAPDAAAAVKKLDADYQEKLADLKSAHDAKLASLKTAYDQQIAQLKSDLQVRIDQRAKALADLKQADAQALADFRAQHQKPTVTPSSDGSGSEIINVPGRQTDKPGTDKSGTDAPAADHHDAEPGSDTSAVETGADAPAADHHDAEPGSDTSDAETGADAPAADHHDAEPGAIASDAPAADHHDAEPGSDTSVVETSADHQAVSAAKTNTSVAKTDASAAKTDASRADGFQIILPAEHHAASAHTDMVQAVSADSPAHADNPVHDQSAAEQTLPQTGSRQSTGLAALGMMMLSFAAGLFARRKKND